MSETPQSAYAALRAAQRQEPLEPERRRALLRRLRTLLLDRRADLVTALDADFGGRNAIETLLAEVLAVCRALDLNRRRLRRWARPRRAGVPLPFWPARAQVVPRPKGVVGILAPWNYPAQLSLWPLADALAAGNRAAVKLPEATPRTAALLAELLRELDPTVVRAVEGGAEVAAAFAGLPWDHLFYTGSTRVAVEVLRAAAPNLTPTTLELGGKCPVVVTADADLPQAAAAVLRGKLLNGGQTCLAPDTVLLVGLTSEAFIGACREALAGLQPLDDVTRPLRPRPQPQGGVALGPLRLVPDPPSDSPLLREEIFGLELPLLGLRDLDGALDWIAERPAPLSIYYFGRDEVAWGRLRRETRSGALVRNATVLQGAMEGVPFGGVGASGFGRYHGEAGFRTFSDLRTEVRFPRRYLARLLERPYGRRTRALLERLLR